MPTQNHKPLPDKRQTASPEREAAIAKFWDKYIDIIHKKGIKEPFDRWFVIRARQYIEAFPDKRLALHSTDDLTEYLEILGRNSSWQAWQFQQVVDAIELLLREMVHLSWVDAFEWGHWKASAKTLSNQYPQIGGHNIYFSTSPPIKNKSQQSMPAPTVMLLNVSMIMKLPVARLSAYASA